MDIIKDISDLGIMGILMFTMYIQYANNDKITHALNDLTVAINRLLEIERAEEKGETHD